MSNRATRQEDEPAEAGASAEASQVKRAVVGFMMAILVVGLVRFGLTISGAADDIAKYSSMTVIILAGCIYFGVQNLAWRDLARVSYLLILPYVTVELGGIGYTWATEKATIFHAHQYSFGLSVGLHFWGHLLGGLTWEPLSLFVLMLIVRALSTRWTSWNRRRKLIRGV